MSDLITVRREKGKIWSHVRKNWLNETPEEAGLRPNVMIELGFALNHQTSKRLLLLFNPFGDAQTVPFDTSSFRYEQIGEAADITGKLRPHLEAIVAEAKLGRI